MLRYVLTTMVACALVACSTAPRTAEGRSDLRAEAEEALDRIQDDQPTLARILDDSHGYVVFPTVGKGAAVVGGAHGRGIVYERGNVVGYAQLTEVSAGLQLGGQAYTQIVAFENENAMDRFKDDQLAFDAQASAVAIEAGASARTTFRNGVAVFVVDEKGLMYEAALAGQRLSFRPL
jgi:lipid-binding SYLF domain-containing protein